MGGSGDINLDFFIKNIKICQLSYKTLDFWPSYLIGCVVMRIFYDIQISVKMIMTISGWVLSYSWIY